MTNSKVIYVDRIYVNVERFFAAPAPMTGAQIRMGRAAVRWSQTELAKRSGISMPTIRRMEAVDGPPPGTHRAVQRVQAALEAAGVVFLPENDEGPGVRWRRAPDEAEA